MNLTISQPKLFTINKTTVLAFIMALAVCFIYNIISQPKVVNTPIQSIYYNQFNAVDTIYPLH